MSANPTNELSNAMKTLGKEIQIKKKEYQRLKETPSWDYYKLLNNCKISYDALKAVYNVAYHNQNFVHLPKNDRQKFIDQMSAIYSPYRAWVLDGITNKTKYALGGEGKDFINSSQFKYIENVTKLMENFIKVYQNAHSKQNAIDKSSKQANVQLKGVSPILMSKEKEATTKPSNTADKQKSDTTTPTPIIKKRIP